VRYRSGTVWADGSYKRQTEMIEIDWNAIRIKLWHGALVLACAYAAVDTRYAWAMPVLTMWAGVSEPPRIKR